MNFKEYLETCTTPSFNDHLQAEGRPTQKAYLEKSVKERMVKYAKAKGLHRLEGDLKAMAALTSFIYFNVICRGEDLAEERKGA
jgi:hypothetical protein